MIVYNAVTMSGHQFGVLVFALILRVSGIIGGGNLRSQGYHVRIVSRIKDIMSGLLVASRLSWMGKSGLNSNQGHFRRYV